MLHLHVVLRGLGRDNGADWRVGARLVGLLAGGAGAGGVEARGVLGGNANDMEVVVVGGAGDIEVGDVPGQSWARTALGESLEGSREGERGQEGKREKLHGGLNICTA